MVTEHELSEIRTLIERHSGLLFEGSREQFFATRVRAHVSEKRMAHGSELLRTMRASGVEYEALLERLLTQETSFFRYPDVFDALEKRVLPDLQRTKFRDHPRSLRIWSAGCANGAEPYSIAITLAETLKFPEAGDIGILATDISRQALQQAERGGYSKRELQGVSPAQLHAYFTPDGDHYIVKPQLRSLVSFASQNLAQNLYLGRFDCIFCMNVLIYFSAERRAALIQRFHEYLEPGGFLFLGHAETANGVPVKFDTLVHGEARVYRKPDHRLLRAVSLGREAAWPIP
jgi:chemotaxis protein methyltransferase CheR